MTENKTNTPSSPSSCSDCLTINVYPSLTMQIDFTKNQYLYLCGHCGETIPVKLKQGKKNNNAKPPQKASKPDTTIKLQTPLRLRSKSSDQDTNKASDNNITTPSSSPSLSSPTKSTNCPKCSENWKKPKNNKNQAESSNKRNRSDPETTTASS